MTLGTIREYGVRSAEATCEDCRHEATVSVDALLDRVYVPDMALQLRCSVCGSKAIHTRPNWREHTAPAFFCAASPSKARKVLISSSWMAHRASPSTASKITSSNPETGITKHPTGVAPIATL